MIPADEMAARRHSPPRDSMFRYAFFGGGMTTCSIGDG